LLELVKASITGAILGNILLIFGLSIMTSGFKFKEQFFNKENVGMQTSHAISGCYRIDNTYYLSGYSPGAN
jgi:calcium/proton exchanger cax